MLDPKRLSLAGGIVAGIWFFFLTLFAFFTGYGVMGLTVLSDLYPGYTISWGGAFVGLIYGFVEGYIFFCVLARLYNRFGRR